MFTATVIGWSKFGTAIITALRCYAVSATTKKAFCNSQLKPLYLDMQATTPMVTTCFISSIESNRLPVCKK